jgi:hypothetical protein
MSEKDTLVLSDKLVVPTDEYISSIIGEKKLLWQMIISHTAENYTDVSGSWNYYNDGKQWLFKLVRKKKTIFWAGILRDTFRISFWFGDKAEPIIEKSDLPQNIKDDFKSAKKYGSIRSVSIKVYNNSDVENVIKLIDIKNKIK